MLNRWLANCSNLHKATVTLNLGQASAETPQVGAGNFRFWHSSGSWRSTREIQMKVSAVG
ncbi:hypothetical protein SCLCIDRAFT_1213737 [Scleroderma citrinum Foug A]|uniref:Uncharacterized protein n=1 Tax=Scleroderma citrinum Foug A TaxID=1036808 RepID=A0A0C3E7E1_9AGAM|nr:hypothetical protein SCLCIDRAFT_1213737 [Scleroderma citrinum Foug A]